MDEVLEFLKKNKTYYVGTVDGDQPEIRPFGTVLKYNDKLYIQTGMVKDCYKQMVANPKITICCFDQEAGMWLRLNATAEPDDSIEICEAMLNDYPHLRNLYTPGDGNTVVVALTNATARFCSFREPERVVKF